MWRLLFFSFTLAAAEPADTIVRLLTEQSEAWNRGDIAGFCAPYADDCVFLSPSGLSRGRQTVQDRYTKKYGGAKQTMGRLALEILDARSAPASVSVAMVPLVRIVQSPL